MSGRGLRPAYLLPITILAVLAFAARLSQVKRIELLAA